MANTNTTNNLVPFQFNGRHLRSLMIDGEPWFVAADVCAHLEIANSRDALTRLDEDEKGVVSTDTLGGAQEVSIVSESGLYSLVLGSRKPEAKAFKKWVTAEVLPSIRKTGSYGSADPLAGLPPEQRALVVLMVEQAEQKRRLELVEAETAIQADKIHRIEAKQQAIEDGAKFFTIIGYVNWRGLPDVTLSEAASLGKRATRMSKERGILIDRVRDPRFGIVGSYHESVLEALFVEFSEGI